MNFIPSKNPDEGAQAMAERIAIALTKKQQVLWLICGGSNIPTAAEAMNEIRKIVPADTLHHLTVAQTDERYGPVGHKDSNWKQMHEAGFDFSRVNVVPILAKNAPLQMTVEAYAAKIQPIFEEAISHQGLIVAQFGMGEDGHIAGMLPHTPAIHDEKFVSGYESKPFTRISLTPAALRKIDAAYAFVFGEPKRTAVANLQNKELSLDDEPAQILKELPEVHFYSDLV